MQQGCDTSASASLLFSPNAFSSPKIGSPRQPYWVVLASVIVLLGSSWDGFGCAGFLHTYKRPRRPIWKGLKESIQALKGLPILRSIAIQRLSHAGPLGALACENKYHLLWRALVVQNRAVGQSWHQVFESVCHTKGTAWQVVSLCSQAEAHVPQRVRVGSQVRLVILDGPSESVWVPG